MLELWNNWYETLVSVEALASVVVIVVVAARRYYAERKLGGDKTCPPKMIGETSAKPVILAEEVGSASRTARRPRSRCPYARGTT